MFLDGSGRATKKRRAGGPSGDRRIHARRAGRRNTRGYRHRGHRPRRIRAGERACARACDVWAPRF